MNDIIKKKAGVKMNREEFEKVNVFGLGESNEAYAKYFIGESYLNALTKVSDGVRVNAIAPGAIETNIWNVPGMNKEDAKKHQDGIASTISVKRFGTPDEVANIALFLVSDEAMFSF